MTRMPDRKDLVAYGPRSKTIVGRIGAAVSRDPQADVNPLRSELLAEAIIDHLRAVGEIHEAIRPRQEQWQRVAQYAAELASAAPPLTQDQRDRIAFLMGESDG